MRQIETHADVREAVVDLFAACLDYTHSNQGEDLNRTAYMAIDELTHALVFWVGAPQKVREMLDEQP